MAQMAFRTLFTPIKVYPDVANFIDRWFVNVELEYARANFSWGVPFGAVFCYVLAVFWMLPRWMRDRKPFSLQATLLAYNAAIVATNAYVCVRMYFYARKYWDIRCLVKDMEPKELDTYLQEIYIVGYIYHLSKYADLLDTIFFVLRKKHNQVSFLHVFHHSLVVILTYLPIVEEIYGSYMVVGLVINTAVHVMTYSYYALAALGPKVQKYLWWKRYLTMIQIIQFWVILGYIFYGLWSGCEKFSKLQVVGSCFILVLFALFCHYYRQHFIQKAAKRPLKNLNNGTSNGTPNGCNGTSNGTSNDCNGTSNGCNGTHIGRNGETDLDIKKTT